MVSAFGCILVVCLAFKCESIVKVPFVLFCACRKLMNMMCTIDGMSNAALSVEGVAMEIGLSTLLAYVLTMVSIVLIYHGLFMLCRILYRRSLGLLLAFLIFVSPFAYVLAGVSSLVELMWVLSLTPFFGVAVMMMLFTSWMIRFYSVAFSVLAVAHFLFLRQRFNGSFVEDRARFAFVNDRADMGRVHVVALSDAVGVARRRFDVVRVFRKYWNFALVFVLSFALLSTLVVSPEVSLRDPTYQEVVRFVASDRTDQRRYDLSSACVVFAKEFRSNANKAGLKCAYVVVYFPEGFSHALNAFNTTDRGLIFVEPQSDEVFSLVIGESYWNRSRYMAPGYDDTVLSYRSEW